MAEEYPFGISELNQELSDKFSPGEELYEEDFEELKVKPPKRPSFPIGTFIFAVIKDSVDIASLGLIGTFTNIVAIIVIRIYLFRKVGFIKRYLYRRYIFALILEFIPWINMIPQLSIFVLRAYLTERKKIDEVLTSIENLIFRFQKGKPGLQGIRERIIESVKLVEEKREKVGLEPQKERLQEIRTGITQAEVEPKKRIDWRVREGNFEDYAAIYQPAPDDIENLRNVFNSTLKEGQRMMISVDPRTDKPVGYLLYKRSESHPTIVQIKSFGTGLEQRAKGAGRALVEKLKEDTSTQSMVVYSSPEAIKNYQNYGFREVAASKIDKDVFNMVWKRPKATK